MSRRSTSGSGRRRGAVAAGGNVDRRADLLGQERFLWQRRFGEGRRRGAKRRLQHFEDGIGGRPLPGLRQTLNPVIKRHWHVVDDKSGHGLILSSGNRAVAT